MFNFMLTYMAQTKSKSGNKLDSIWIMTIVNRIPRWSHELKDLSSECQNTGNKFGGQDLGCSII